MTYFLNLSLPVYFMLLPLGIAVVLAANLYRVQSIFGKMKANYQVQLREAQNRLDTALNSEAENIERLNNVHREKLHALESELAKYKLAIRQADDNLNDVRLTWSVKSEKDAEIIRGLNAQAVEREALISQIRSNLDAYVFKSNQLDIKVSKWAFELDELDALVKQLRGEIEQLESKLQLSELAHIETQADLDGERYYLDAVAKAYRVFYMLVRNNSRPRKQYGAILDKMGDLERKEFIKLNKDILDMTKEKPTETPQSETVVHDILGVARVFQADQSESVNNSHIKDLSNEVVRGVKEQAEVINKELASVDIRKIEIGDSLVYYGGLIRKVVDLGDNNGGGYPIWIKVENESSDSDLIRDEVGYALNGSYWVNGDAKHEFDIIQIIKPAKCYKSNKPCDFGCNGLCKES